MPGKLRIESFSVVARPHPSLRRQVPPFPVIRLRCLGLGQDPTDHRQFFRRRVGTGKREGENLPGGPEKRSDVALIEQKERVVPPGAAHQGIVPGPVV